MNAARLVLGIAAALIVVVPAHAGVREEWAVLYDGPSGLEDIACGIAADAQGHVYVTGKSVGMAGWNDYVTIRYDLLGCEDWVSRYDGPGARTDNARDIAVDALGCAYVTGLSWNDATDYDFATIKYAADGAEEWVAFYNGSGNGQDYPSAIAVDDAGNAYVTGFSCVPGPNYDYVTIKYDSDGNEEWAVTYNGPRDMVDAARDMAVDAAGYVYVTGQSEGVGTSSDFVTIKYTPDGTEEWVSRYDGPGHNADSGYAIGLDLLGNVYVTGDSWDPDSEDDIVTIKYDSDGNEKWVSIYDGPVSSDDMPQAIGVDGAGCVRVTGMSHGSGWNFDYVTIGYDVEGNEEWVSRYDGPGGGDDLAFGLVLDDAGNTYVTGRSWGGVSTSYDCATIKYDHEGEKVWVARHDGVGNDVDEALSIVLDGLGRVCVAGRSRCEGADYDYLTIVYGEGEVTEVEGGGVKELMLFPAHPNPFTDETTIRFEAPRGVSQVSVAVFDTSGRLVRHLFDEPAVGGRCLINWNGADEQGRPVASGVYFCRMQAEGFDDAVKMVLLR
jgi:hypothetical protein